jgi:alkylation response protein AidB-like acyl-CoA dehydrogenase
LDFGFTEDQQRLIDHVSTLVRERIAPRAAQYDQAFEAPAEDIQDIHREGWLLANLDPRRLHPFDWIPDFFCPSRSNVLSASRSGGGIWGATPDTP